LIQVIKKAVYKHGYIFIAAAWLYTISFLFTNYFSYSSSPAKVSRVLEAYIKKEEQRFAGILKDTSAVAGIVSGQPSEEKDVLQDDVFGLYAYRLNSMGKPVEIYWNNNTMSADMDDIMKPDGYYFTTYKNGSFDFIKQTVTYKGSHYIFTALVPVKWNYFFNDKYLAPWFQNFPELAGEYEISYDGSGAEVRNSKNDVFFRIKKIERVSPDRPGSFSTLLRVLAVILLIVFINSIATDIVGVVGFFKAFMLLAGVVFVLRYLTYYFPIPFNFRQLSLFQQFKNTGKISQSLGDLLINSVLLYWVTAFIKFNRPKFFQKGFIPDKRVMIFFTIVSIAILLFILYFFEEIITGLVDNSGVNFEVTNFFTIDVSIIVSFVIICMLLLSFFYLSHLFIKPLLRSGLNFNNKLLAIIVIGLFFITTRSFNGRAIINFLVLVWFIIYILVLERRKSDAATNIIESPLFLFWAIFFMLSATALVSYRIKEIELGQRKKIAANYAVKTSEETQQLIGISANSIDTLALNASFPRFYNYYLNKAAKDSLINEDFQDYLDKYNTRIYTYDALHNQLFNDDSTPYSVIKAIVQGRAKKTAAAGLYYYENSPEAFSYIYEKEIYSDNGMFEGSFFIVVDPKIYDRDALFSPLFRQVKNLSTDDNTNYSIAVYKSGHLVKTSNNDYDFSDTITPKQTPLFGDTLTSKKGFSQYWYNAGSDKIIVVVKKSDWFLTSFTIFSYLFCLFIALVIFLHYSNMLFKTGFRWRNLKVVFSFNIRTQIQATIIAVSIFSFIIIGVITISFFVISFNKDSADKLTHTANVIKNEIEEEEKKQGNDEGEDNSRSYNAAFKRRINEMASIQNTDVNFYDRMGNLVATSQPYIYANQILSNKMQPLAYYTLHYNHGTKFIQYENIGNITYLSIYVVVRDAKGRETAYINIPLLNSQNELKEEINNFLVTLITINALIFIFAGGIAILVTSRITSSFTLIGSKMKDVSLGRVNEEIVWKSRDEIGALVDEYNKMVRKLEQSAQALARSEREGAWREMARQVAHEIKNPLTPMKLSIQYLQRAINNNAPNVKELSQQVANTLIEQIEQLSKIAGDFSQFANIGNVVIEDFDVSEVLASLVNLYRADSELHLVWNKPETPCIIKADKVQINRLFTNLIKNAVEAYNKTDVIEIAIEQYIKGNNVIISIADKGSGIPEETQQKIFIPNFTTKTSGTGLGLAICHGIVEKANGAIWFSTQHGKGTTFYVSLPLVNAD